MPALTDDEPGELLQKLGEDGARRAKLWLDATTRVMATWSVYDKFGRDRLLYPWPAVDRSYSYDLGGVFFGGDLHQQSFLVECKKYNNPSQGGHFDKFLAQSYVTLRDNPTLADNFIWITWHPFRQTDWTILYTAEKINAAIVKERERIFGDVTEEDAKTAIDPGIVDDLSKRVWIIVLSDRQETLVISTEDRAEIDKIRTLRGER